MADAVAANARSTPSVNSSHSHHGYGTTVVDHPVQTPHHDRAIQVEKSEEGPRQGFRHSSGGSVRRIRRRVYSSSPIDTSTGRILRRWNMTSPMTKSRDALWSFNFSLKRRNVSSTTVSVSILLLLFRCIFQSIINLLIYYLNKKNCHPRF